MARRNYHQGGAVVTLLLYPTKWQPEENFMERHLWGQISQELHEMKHMKIETQNKKNEWAYKKLELIRKICHSHNCVNM